MTQDFGKCKQSYDKKIWSETDLPLTIFLYPVNSADGLFQAAHLIIFPALLDVGSIEQFQRHMAHFPLAVFLPVLVKFKP
jgi:hypothetical protein